MPSEGEPQPQEFDVGKIARDYQAKFLGTSPNLAMPATMLLLVAELEALTQKIEERNAARGVTDDQLHTDVTRWRVRLDDYAAQVANASSPDDRQAILWSVTAPLLLGWFGGPEGQGPLPAGGFPPGFNTTAQHGTDVATPFSLANQLGVWEDWDARRVDLLLEDLEDEAIKTATGIGAVAKSSWPWVVGGLAAAALVGVVAYRAGKDRGGVDVRIAGNGTPRLSGG